MSPSDMVLKIENNTAGYNNLIRKADVQEFRIQLKLGKNDDLNKQVPNIPPNPTNYTGEKGVFIPQSQDKPVTTPPTSSILPAATAPISGKTAPEHEDNKSA